MAKLIVLLVFTSAFQISQTDVLTSSDSESYSYSSSSSSSASSSSSLSSSQEWSSSSQPQVEECGPPVIRPPKCTKPNEVLEICPARCPFRTCGIDDTLIDCAPSPVPGDADCPPPTCRCKPQFFRNDKGNCVPWEKCPKCKNPNEVYDPCDAPCPGRRCDVDLRLVKCGRPPKVGDPECVVGCRCIDGYVRDCNGVCIPIEQCPPIKPVCGPNEEYDPCPDCSLQTCETMNATYSCPAMPADKKGPGCKPSCRCIKGYFRNKIGECIAARDCLKCTKPHEYYSCGGACDNVCENIKEQNQTNCPIINVKCNEMCYCEKDYARDYKNDCIPIKKCPTCPANERYDPCPATLGIPQTCDEAGYPLKCAPRKDGAPCPGKPGCVCKDGYLRNKKGKCIPSDQCPSCGGDKNATLGCGVNCNRHCSDLNQKDPQKCIKICYPNSCDCRTDKHGNKYYYDDNTKKCVLPQDCTKCKKPNEVYDQCDAPCPGRRCDVDPRLVRCKAPPKVGDPECLVGCRCIDGYARDSNGVCIPREKCPKCKNPNEVYDQCDAPCPGRRCDVDPRLVKCGRPPKVGDPECLVGCRCIDGYARDKNGVCIPRDKCPKCKNPNEVYDQCDAPCPGRRCDVDIRLILCKPPPKVGDPDCVVGCRCIDGYARDKNGVCIPRDKCPPIKPVCGQNEEYDPCPDCSLQTCETMNATYHCPLIPADKKGPRCKPSCRCIKGYYRNKLGQCIAASDCLKCTKPHEYYSCGGACDNVCENIKEQNQTNCPIINVKCNEMCYCEKDYARDYKNDCIPIKDCPTCPANERYDPCPENLCQPKTCDEAGYPLNCTLRQDGAPCPGKPGCVCKDGYLRNKKGICIPSDQCPSCGGDKNATYGCGVNCNRHCSNLNQKEPQMCILICYPNSCDCRTDENGNKYYYDDNTKKCVLPQDCTPQCQKNEVYSDCVNGGCGKQNCTEINKPVVCRHPKVCESGCICAPGYLRAKNGTCVPSEQCYPPPNCEANEEFSKCGRDGCLKYYCSDLDLPPLCRDTFECIPQCECKEGYLRVSEENRTCVPIDECKKQCKKNEQYSDCPSAACRPLTCKQAGYPVPCPVMGPKGQCPGDPGCICNPGYLRNDKGICVPQEECPSCGGDKNAIPGCGNHCGNTCENYNSTKPVICPLFCNLNGCDCKKKYVYDSNIRKCVLPEQCTPTCKVNEEYSTCVEGICRAQDCSEKDKSIPCPGLTEGSCTTGCVCKEKYLRAKNGTCVPEDECDYKKCKVNEQYSECPSALCRPQTCKEAGYPIPCPIVGPDEHCSGDPGCICNPGYLRNDKGICIPEKECPSCGGDKNAVPGCGNHCGNTCATYNSTKPIICTLICNLNGCDCKKNYVYDGNLRKCVLPEQCTPTCKVNEEYSTCVEGICRAQNCTEKDKSIPCPDLREESCTKGCVCKEKYLRAKNGTCVPEDQCDHKQCKDNEQYSECPSALCQPLTCKQAGYPFSCSVTGPSGGQCGGGPGCICNPGYLRNDKGICVPKEECPSCGGDENAVSGCGNHCGKSCATYEKPVPCPLFCNVNGCDCRDKYIYDDNLHKCVLPEKCTPTCQVNEEFSNCTNAICRPQDCADKGKTIAYPALADGYCTAGCVCKENYLRNKNGTCVPEDQCEPTCPYGEILSDCPPVKCDAEYCPKSRNDPQTCPIPKKCGPPRCVCGFNSHRDRKTGKCIATADCPPFPCDGPNEKYQSCPPVCPGENCTDYLNNATCPKYRIGIVVPCKPACRCVKGYYRNPKGICVSGKKCKDYVCKVNEEYSTCSNGLCRVQDCADKGKKIPCPVVAEGCCTEGCVCKECYLRAKNGTCVPEDQCDSC